MHIRRRLLVAAALGNAAAILGLTAAILGLSTAIKSMYWIWRELSLAGAAAVRVAHLSDLHIVGERYGCRMEAGADGPRGSRVIRSALRKLASVQPCWIAS